MIIFLYSIYFPIIKFKRKGVVSLYSKIINVEATCRNIKKLCMEKGIMPRELADCMGFTSVTAIYKWFAGQNMPSIDNLVILSALLDVSLEDILVVDDISVNN